MNGSADTKPKNPGRSKSPAYRAYLYSVICLGLASILFALYQLPHTHIGWKWLILAGLTIISSTCTIRIPATNSKISIGDTLFFTNIILFGTPAGILTAAIDALVSSLRARNRSRRLEYSLFNVAAIAGAAQVSGLVFFWAIARAPLAERAMPAVADMLFPLAALAFVHYICNSGSVAIIVALEKHKNIIEIWKDSFLWTSITYFAGAAAAGFIALTVGSITPQVVGIAASVILAIYFTYKTYLDKVQQVCSLAYYDSLTNLPNRILFKEKLNQALALADSSNRMLAVMFLDLDNFKRINDTYGHGAGDSLLRCVAARLTSTLRIQDREAQGEIKEQDIVIGRFGGDEFTIVLTGIENPTQVGQIAQRILQAFTSPFSMNGLEISAAASIGISLSTLDGTNADTLLKNADAAMFHAKDSGRNSFQFYSQSMNELSLAKLSVENDLRKAIGKGEFRLHYQPKVDSRTRAITGAEALIRWQHPTRGLLPPREFIPIAEETGLIRPIGEWVLRSVCQQIVAWQKAGLDAVPVAVNLSGIQFMHQHLQQLVSQILRETSLDPSFLELEITESMIMHDEELADAALRDLRKLGCKISIDDFGTGYSSLSRLKHFTLDALKIDRSFVTDLTNNPDDRAIAKAIIAMARSLELKVIAEGVETEQQFQFFQGQGCDEIQGYLFGRPMPAEEFALLLSHRMTDQPIDSVESGAGVQWAGTSPNYRFGIRRNHAHLRLVSVRTDLMTQPLPGTSPTRLSLAATSHAS
jgi:diguanylate cyclase (GGDEF)-like protein